MHRLAKLLVNECNLGSATSGRSGRTSEQLLALLFKRSFAVSRQLVPKTFSARFVRGDASVLHVEAVPKMRFGWTPSDSRLHCNESGSDM